MKNPSAPTFDFSQSHKENATGANGLHQVSGVMRWRRRFWRDAA